MEQQIIMLFESQNENTKRSLIKEVQRRCWHKKCKYRLRLFLEELKTMGIWNPADKRAAIMYLEMILFNHAA